MMMEKIQVNAFTSMSVGAAEGRLYLFVEDGSGDGECHVLDVEAGETLLQQMTLAVLEARQQAHCPPDEVALAVGLKPAEKGGSVGVQLKLTNPRTKMGARTVMSRHEACATIRALQACVMQMPLGVG